MAGLEHPLRPVVTGWHKAVQAGQTRKRERFQKDADDAVKFLSGPYDWLYAGGSSDRHFRTPDINNDPQAPSFQMTLNKAAELVQLFGPSLYHRNPTRKVSPRKQPVLPPEAFGLNPADPMQAQAYQQALAQLSAGRTVDQVRAGLLEAYLNYTPSALDLKTEARWAVDEAILKGGGLLWTEVYQSPGAAHKLVGSFFDSIDNLVIDPDATSLRDAKWVARRCLHPVWEAERRYGLPPGSLPAGNESRAQQAATEATGGDNYPRATGKTNDLIEYWQVYSKMGLGGRLTGSVPSLRTTLEGFGDFCFVAIAPHVPYPLNLPPALTESPDQAAALAAARWPTPFWCDGSWPFTMMSFHSVPGDPWPLSHLAPGMGELKFLNWAFSFLAGKVRTTCRDFLAVRKDAADDFRNTLLNGRDLSMLEYTHDAMPEQVMQFLQHPAMNGDLLNVIAMVSENFDRRVGLTELMYGQSANQLRSAAEADLKAGQLNIRPDDMANKVEDAMSSVARAEAFAARWHLTAADVRPVLGDLASSFWGQSVEQSDPAEIVNQLETRVEAGSTKKPTPERDAANLQTAMNTLFPPLLQLAQMGNPAPVNALVQDWAASMGMDAEKYLIELPTPAPVGPTPQEAAPAA